MKFGAEIVPKGVRFRLWAPKHQHVSIELADEAVRLPMCPLGGGWHELIVASARPGTRYSFVLPGGSHVPDPASRFQPFDVHGPSEVIDPSAYEWRDGAWRGRPWEESIIYELHIGAFTPEGTFRAAIDRLDHLARLGVTAIEIMPIADFPGRRNWGYDGVLLFAPDSSYGRPEDLKALIEAAHLRGLMVFLDVVYNHFGPEGNYLPSYAPVLTDRHKTPWGPAINYDAEGSEVVRDLIIANALYWIHEYRIDGLRLDAIHAIRDESAEHVLTGIAKRVRESAAERHVHLILENDRNEATCLMRDARGRPTLYSAQWNDDVHHGLHSAATGETAGYYGEYAGDIHKLARALAEGFAFQGEIMHYRGEPRGEPSAGLPPTAFIAFIQNHDQIGNRAFGKRLAMIAPAAAMRAVAAIYLLMPQIPMMFMGEEWAAAQTFPFFCDFGPDLARIVREGRRVEFAKFPQFRDPEQAARIPDPCAEQTFLSAKLCSNDAEHGTHAEWLSFYRELIAVRRREIIPRLQGMRGHSGCYEILNGSGLRVAWLFGDGSRLALTANLSASQLDLAESEPGRRIWAEGEGTEARLGAWSVVWTLAQSDRHDQS
jgi:maltooligosyltrehalose trehalohydrolase